MQNFNQHSTSWTPEKDEYVRENYRIISTKKIGEKLGFSKNAVIGRAHRLGLGKPYAEVFNVGTKYGTKPKASINQGIRMVKRATGCVRMRQENPPKMKKLPFPELNDSIIPLNGTGVKLWELGGKGCRWVLGEPKDLMFCGHNSAAGSSYCQDHHNWTMNRK